MDLKEGGGEGMGLRSAAAGGRRVAQMYAPAATELQIRGDVVQLQQVVLNLIMNAMDAISRVQVGKREIGVTTIRSGAYAEIRIGDTGPGIAASDLKNVFDRFFTTKPQGMGMGLAIVRTIVEAHHGQISVENQLSGGALFTIRLPIARSRSTSA